MAKFDHLTAIPKVARKAQVDLADGGAVSVGNDPRPKSYFMRGGRGPLFQQWRPALREMGDVVAESWESATSRALDAIANSGFIAGAIEQAIANDVGTGLRPRPMPENNLFGQSDADARAWARMVEIRYGLWANAAQECDIEGRATFGKLQAAAYRAWFPTGEILAEYPWRMRPWNTSGAKVRLLSPHRLSRESDDLRRLKNGVYLDRDMMPVGYRARKTDRVLGEVSYDVAARDRLGRLRVAHVYDGLPETYRGISPLTPVLRVVRQFDQFTDATLTAAIVQSLFAATIKSEAPTEQVLEGLLTPQEQAQATLNGLAPLDAWLEASQGYYDAANLNVGINGRLGFLFPGDELEFHSASHPGPDYKAVASFLMLEFARAIGLDYASATGDYAGSTYYTLGKAGGDVHELRKYRRANILAPFCQPAYEAWLEGEIEADRIAFPGGIEAFRANRAAACRAHWVGSPRPIADELKFAKAVETLERLGIASEFFLSEQWGLDYEDTLQERAAAKKLRVQYGIADPVKPGAPVPGNPTTPGPESDDEEDPDE